MNIYQQARAAAGLTQERAAEALAISVESLRLYETDRRIPPNCIVSRMSDLYNTQYLIIQHVRQADDLARSLLPDPQLRPLEQTSIRMYRLVRDFVQNHRTDDLIDIAEDGIIDESERPKFYAIMKELEEITAAFYELRMNGGKEE
ncbi:MAG: helix-turn-helix transcriptional regulator [Clostridia bacterium]|nr:helix-turn-helix transcriptional regulator [Clostridia bacterium]